MKNVLNAWKRESNYVLLSTSITALVLPIQSITGQEKRPNIIFMLTDDQAYWTLGASGNINANTPNIDRLAHSGAYLINAFVTTPVSSPSRASIMTSRYASEFDILDFIPETNHRLHNPSYTPGLSPESITFAEVLQDAGYETGLVGKWHLGNWYSPLDMKYHPTNHGFSFFMGLTGGGTTPVDPILEIDGRVKKFEGLTTDILTDHALQFIKDNADTNFLLCFNTRAPHEKWLPVAVEDWAPFENMDPYLPNPDYPELDIPDTKRMMREYLASIHGVDRNFGRIVALLDELGLSENTIIIFFSDNGYNVGHNGVNGKGNGVSITAHAFGGTKNTLDNRRPNMYDNSLRVPAIVFWPGVIEPGTVIKHTITSLDIYPTILDMAGVELPDSQIVRGRSFLPLLKGEEINDWCDEFYGEYSMINYSNAYMRCYRTHEWKLVLDFLNPERNELYHICYDPEENINLIHDSSNEIQQVIKDLRQKILLKMDQINDPLLDEVEVDIEYYKK